MRKIVKTTAIALIFIFIGLVFFRIWLSDYYPAKARYLVPNERLGSVYNEKGGDLYAFAQKGLTPYDGSMKGNFFFAYFVRIPEAEQVQVTVRYNLNTLDNIKKDFTLDTLPSEYDERFTFVLRDSDGGVHYPSKSVKSALTVYRYQRLVYDGVPDAPVLYLDVYFGPADIENDKPYGSMMIYNNLAPVKEYKIKTREIEEKGN